MKKKHVNKKCTTDPIPGVFFGYFRQNSGTRKMITV
jgi:hypothetical protein